MNTTQTRSALVRLRQSLCKSTNEQTDRDLLGRFAAGDEHAFATLVHRHGRMVLGVCRGVLHNRADAEDAFQAVFLALARKAGQPFSGACLGGWLHVIARRAAVKLRGSQTRRRMHERQAGERNQTLSSSQADLREVLDEEVSRLPETCREAILRCYFHGQTREQAALQLDWSLRTLERRLEQGRELLRERLTARGVTLGVLLALAPTAVPRALADVTVRSALGGAPNKIAELARHAAAGVAAVRWKFVLLGALLAGLATGAGLIMPAKTDTPARASAPPAPVGKLPAAVALNPDEQPLPEHAIARLGTTRFRHGFVIYGIAYSKDGKILASVGGGRGLCLWEADTGRLLHHFNTRRLPTIYTLALSPDGRYAAVAEAVTLKLVGVKTGKEVRQFTGHTNGVTSVAYSPRGNLLASGSHDYSVRLWDPESVRQLHLLEGHTGAVWGLAFRHDGNVIASGSLDGDVRLWDARTGKLLHVCKGHSKALTRIAFEPAGKRLVSAADDGSVRVWNSDTGKQERTLLTDTEPVICLAFAPDGKTLAVGVGDRTVRLLDFATGKEVRRWIPHAFRPGCLAFSPDGKTLASGTVWDSTVRLWDPQTGKEKAPGSGHVGPVDYLVFMKNGRRLLSFGRDGRLLDWDLATKKNRLLHSGAPPMPLGPIAVTPDGKFLAWGSRRATESTVRLVETATGKEERSFTGATKGSLGVAFSPDGEQLASASQDATLRLWHTRTGALVWQTNMHMPVVRLSGFLKSLFFSPDGTMLAHGGGDGILRLFDARTGKLLRRYSYGREIGTMAWSPDSSIVAMTGGYGVRTIVLWNARTGEVSRSLETPQAGAYGVAFSPDGRLLATAGDDTDTTIYLWDVATGGEMAVFKGHACTPLPLAFSPDGRRLASGGGDSSIMLWDVTGRAVEGKLRPGPVSATRFAQLWEKLASDDAKAGHATVWELVAGGEAVVPMLKTKLSAAKPLDARGAARIIADLDADDYVMREKATKEAAKLGLGAEPALVKALGARPGLEPRRRVDGLVAGWLRSPDWLRYRRGVAVLEYIGSDEAKRILRALAAGAEGTRPTKEAAAALARLGGKDH